jgi:predicted glycosyltransferase
VTARLGYYAHHHGGGHVARACAVLRHTQTPVTLLTSHPRPSDLPPGVRYVPLPDDAPRGPADSQPVGPFHYAPTGHAGVRERMAQIAEWAAQGPAVLVVDVSCEVALLGRLLALSVVVVRQHGRRWDGPHAAAYRAAERLVAPFGASLEEPDVPDWIQAKTVYAGGFSRFDAQIESAREVAPEPNTVVVVMGRGGGGPGSAPFWRPLDVASAASATPHWRWTLLGSDAPPNPPPNLAAPGWTDDPFSVLVRSQVVVSAAGHNGVMEAAAAGRPLVLLPERRPFEEQTRKAAALARIGAALVLPKRPEPERWSGLLDRTRRLDPSALASQVDGAGAQRMARLLDELAYASAPAFR